MVCQNFGLSRQAYYQGRKRKKICDQEIEIIVRKVMKIRGKQPRIGGRKLQYKLAEQGIQVGRDRLFDVLRGNGLLVERRRNSPRSNYGGSGPHANLIKNMDINRPYQVLVSDITYIDTDEGWHYLALVSDLKSRAILGWDLSESLEVSSSLKALKMALKKCKTMPDIHHSDQGSQYSSKAYLNHLKNNEIWVSMSRKGTPSENAVAERLNGILKQEFNMGACFKSKVSAVKAVREAIRTYNKERPHLSLGYKSPSEVLNAA